MIALIKEIILDSQSADIFSGTDRQLEVTALPNKATIIIGVRRSGKSTFLNQIAKKFLAEGVSRENMLTINFFDDRLSSLKNLGLDPVIQAYYLLFPQKKSSEKVIFFFDEIQVIPDWESFIDRLLRTENCVIYLTGSSAQLLSQEIATQMRGRALSWELFPFSFREFLDHFGLYNFLPLNSQQRMFVENAFEKYFETGGFPEVINLNRDLRIRIHQEYFNSILFRDLIERHDISHPRALIDLARKMIDSVASMYTLNKLTGFLKSLGHKVPKNSVLDYLNWFEDAYFLFTVRLYDASYKRSNANPKKIYCVDHALVKSVSSNILINRGHLLENLVFISIRSLVKEIFYYSTQDGLEVDFIFKDGQGKKHLIQVCESLQDEKTKNRETKALQKAMQEQDMNEGYIVTRTEEFVIHCESGLIHVLPIWRYLIDNKIFVA
jgi:predicted AAA+ superfamily ATPase